MGFIRVSANGEYLRKNLSSSRLRKPFFFFLPSYKTNCAAGTFKKKPGKYFSKINDCRSVLLVSLPPSPRPHAPKKDKGRKFWAIL